MRLPGIRRHLLLPWLLVELLIRCCLVSERERERDNELVGDLAGCGSARKLIIARWLKDI